MNISNTVPTDATNDIIHSLMEMHRHIPYTISNVLYLFVDIARHIILHICASYTLEWFHIGV